MPLDICVNRKGFLNESIKFLLISILLTIQYFITKYYLWLFIIMLFILFFLKCQRLKVGIFVMISILTYNHHIVEQNKLLNGAKLLCNIKEKPLELPLIETGIFTRTFELKGIYEHEIDKKNTRGKLNKDKMTELLKTVSLVYDEKEEKLQMLRTEKYYKSYFEENNENFKFDNEGTLIYYFNIDETIFKGLTERLLNQNFAFISQKEKIIFDFLKKLFHNKDKIVLFVSEIDVYWAIYLNSGVFFYRIEDKLGNIDIKFYDIGKKCLIGVGYDELDENEEKIRFFLGEFVENLVTHKQITPVLSTNKVSIMNENYFFKSLPNIYPFIIIFDDYESKFEKDKENNIKVFTMYRYSEE